MKEKYVSKDSVDFNSLNVMVNDVKTLMRARGTEHSMLYFSKVINVE